MDQNTQERFGTCDPRLPSPEYSDFDGEEYRVNSLDEFVSGIASNKKAGYQFYRGQTENWKLLPKLARLGYPPKFLLALEEDSMTHFKLRSAPFRKSLIPTPMELLQLMQHYGAYTRLSDWTMNPLAALWFAVSESEAATRTTDSVVWRFNCPTKFIYTIDDGDPRIDVEDCVILPYDTDPRINAQDGIFLVHTFHEPDRGFLPLESNQKIRNCLSLYKIPWKERNLIRQALDEFGINERRLFPDLGGIARHLNWKIRVESAGFQFFDQNRIPIERLPIVGDLKRRAK